MGSSASSLGNFPPNETLQKFVGQESIGDGDPMWEELLSFNCPMILDESVFEKLEDCLKPSFHDLRKHNLRSQNVPALMQRIICYANQLIGSISDSTNISDKDLTLLENGLVVFRLIAKYFLEHSSELKFFKHLSVNTVDGSSSVLECFFLTLFKIIVKVPLSDKTYRLHCESILTCITLLARQMYRELSSPIPIVYIQPVWGKCAIYAPAIVHRLMTNFAENRPTPPSLKGVAEAGIMWRAASSLASGLLTIVTLGYAGRTSNPPPPATAPQIITSTPNTQTPDQTEHTQDLVTSETAVSQTKQTCHLLANLSSLLLLILTTQAGSILKCAPQFAESGAELPNAGQNLYRIALFSLHNDMTNVKSSSPPMEAFELSAKSSSLKKLPGSATPNGKSIIIDATTKPIYIDFALIRDTITSTLHQDSSILLLYLLIYRNSAFRSYLLQDRNYEKLLLPILNILYRSPSKNSHLVYMALILLLVLTEHERFSVEIHNSKIKWVQWSPNRRLSDLSYGSLVVLVLCRTIQYHVNQLKDKYLHVNILAALANLSAKISRLHPYASDVVVSLLQLLTKRHTRTVEQLRQNSEDGKSSDKHEDERGDKQTNSNSVTTSSASEDDLVQELNLLEEVIRMLLEIINSILDASLTSNPNLVYSLLYKRESLNPLRSHPSFQTVIQNIDTVLAFFSKRIETELGPSPTSPSSVMTVIEKQSSNIFRQCHLKKFPDLTFKYVEEESPDEFFIPYVWSVVLRQSGILFKTHNLILFSTRHLDNGCEDQEADCEDCNSPSSS